MEKIGIDILQRAIKRKRSDDELGIGKKRYDVVLAPTSSERTLIMKGGRSPNQMVISPMCLMSTSTRPLNVIQLPPLVDLVGPSRVDQMSHQSTDVEDVLGECFVLHKDLHVIDSAYKDPQLAKQLLDMIWLLANRKE